MEQQARWGYTLRFPRKIRQRFLGRLLPFLAPAESILLSASKILMSAFTGTTVLIRILLWELIKSDAATKPSDTSP